MKYSPNLQKISLTTNKQAERMGSVWLWREGGRGEERRGQRRGEERKWSFVGEALWGFFLPRCQATERWSGGEEFAFSKSLAVFPLALLDSHADCRARALGFTATVSHLETLTAKCTSVNPLNSHMDTVLRVGQTQSAAPHSPSAWINILKTLYLALSQWSYLIKWQ